MGSLTENKQMFCEECGEELADGEDGICDNCAFSEEEDDDFNEDDE